MVTGERDVGSFATVVIDVEAVETGDARAGIERAAAEEMNMVRMTRGVRRTAAGGLRLMGGGDRLAVQNSAVKRATEAPASRNCPLRHS